VFHDKNAQNKVWHLVDDEDLKKLEKDGRKTDWYAQISDPSPNPLAAYNKSGIEVWSPKNKCFQKDNDIKMEELLSYPGTLKDFETSLESLKKNISKVRRGNNQITKKFKKNWR
jgi:hypothetical protein